MAKNNIKIIT